MSLDIERTSTVYQVGNRQWLMAEPDVKFSATLDVSKFSQAGTAEVQTVTITGSPTGGTFTLTYAGQTTTAIAFNAAASAVQSALVALSSIGAGNVVVTGSAGGPYTVTFAGSLAPLDDPAMTASGASLTGGSSPGVTIATATGGANAHYPNNFIPSGTAVGLITATGLYGPYNPSASDGSQTFYGLTYDDATVVRVNGSVASKVGVALVLHQAVVSLARLPFQSGIGSVDSGAKTAVPTIRFVA